MTITTDDEHWPFDKVVLHTLTPKLLVKLTDGNDSD